MLRRIRLSDTPAALRFSVGMDLCVMVAGWLTRLLIPPRLSASLNNWVEVAKAPAAPTIALLGWEDKQNP